MLARGHSDKGERAWDGVTFRAFLRLPLHVTWSIACWKVLEVNNRVAWQVVMERA